MFFFLRSDQYMQDFSCFLVNFFFCSKFFLKGFFLLGNDFEGLSLIKLKLISFFIARYLFDGTGWTRNKSVIWRRFQYFGTLFWSPPIPVPPHTSPQPPSSPHLLKCSSLLYRLRNTNYIIVLLFRMTDLFDTSILKISF